MDVKDVRPDPVTTDPIPTDRVSKPESKAAAVSAGTSDPVTVSLEGADKKIDARSKLNDVISVINVAIDATNELEKLVHSLKGIAEQVDAPEGVPENRKAALQDEAAQLSAAIKEQLNRKGPNGLRPLGGDPVRVQIEEKIGKTLDMILPDHARDNLGLAKIEFSTKEAIIQTKASIEMAAQRLEALRKTVDTSQEQLRATTAALDVGIQNTEAARTSVRDLDSALQLVGDAREEINSNPKEALDSAGSFEKRAQSLLQPS